MASLYSNVFYGKYKRNIYSQNGEDGIIEELLRRIGRFDATDGWVCEFGAWDGMHLSNTFRLIKDKGFNAVFIEGDNEKYADLMKTSLTYDKITPVLAYVSHDPTSSDSLDNLLKATDIPTDFDVLSIDVDSYDYQIWKAMSAYKPKIVIIEINSSVNTDVEEHIHEPGKYQGTGFRPMLTLGKDKGYKFVLHTGNMIFIREDLYDKLDLSYKSELENFRTRFGGK